MMDIFFMVDPRTVLPMTIIACFVVVSHWRSNALLQSAKTGGMSTPNAVVRDLIKPPIGGTVYTTEGLARRKKGKSVAGPMDNEALIKADIMYNRFVFGSRMEENILCFGDSLTKGWGPGHENTHPYAAFLADFTERTVIKSAERGMVPEIIEDRTVVESGYSGEKTNTMVERLPAALKRAHPGLVIILGGTNDLGSPLDISRETIVGNLKELHYLAHNATAKDGGGVHTVHLTIPPSKFITQDKERDRNLKRIAINRDMQQFAKEYNSDDKRRGNVYVLDLEDIFLPFDVFSSMWLPDGLHFTPKGYKEIANMIEHLMKMSKVDAYGTKVSRQGRFGKGGQ